MWIPAQQLYVDTRHVRSRWSLYRMGRKYVWYCRQYVVWQKSHRFYHLYSTHSPSAHSMLSQHTSSVSTQYAESAHTHTHPAASQHTQCSITINTIYTHPPPPRARNNPTDLPASQHIQAGARHRVALWVACRAPPHSSHDALTTHVANQHRRQRLQARSILRPLLPGTWIWPTKGALTVVAPLRATST